MENLNSKIARNPEILANQVDGEVVMMNIEKGKYYGMNKTGNIIWDLLDDEKSVNDIVSELSAKFSLTKEKCESDVIPFIDKMVAENILIISE